MDPKTLQERLSKLHAELSDAQHQHPAAQQPLGEILPDVKRMVDQPDTAPAADKSLPDRLERAAVQLEADHPQLAASARSLIALLSEVGI